jgi:hypothetical protein
MGIKIALPCKLSNGKPMSAPYKSGFFGRFGTEPLPAPDMFSGRVAFLFFAAAALRAPAIETQMSTWQIAKVEFKRAVFY